MPDAIGGKYRRGTTYTVTFPNLPTLDFQPIRVDLLQSQYAHDVLKIKYLTSSDFWFSVLNTGEPVNFRWTRGSVVNEWFGYVYLVSKETAPQRKQEMEIQCIGAAFPLKQQITRVFEDKSITEIAAIIAAEHGFSFIGKEDGRKFSQMAITGQSYWEWLCQQAKRIGYGLVIDGMTLLMRPIDDLINQSMSNVPILTMDATQLPGNSQFLDRTLDYFKVLQGEHIEDGVSHRSVKNVGGIDPHTGTVITASSSPKNVGTNFRLNPADVLFTEQRTEQVVHNITAATSAADGQAHLARFNVPAKIHAQGDGRLRPFAPLYLEGTGSLTDGYWMVRHITHKFALIGDYQIEAEISTDGLGSLAASEYRPSEISRAGTVPLNVGNLAVYTPNASGSIAVTLESNGFSTFQANRGYLRTPSRWVSVGNINV